VAFRYFPKLLVNAHNSKFCFVMSPPEMHRLSLDTEFMYFIVYAIKCEEGLWIYSDGKSKQGLNLFKILARMVHYVYFHIEWSDSEVKYPQLA